MEKSNKVLESSKLEEYLSNFKIRYLLAWIVVPFILAVILSLLERRGLVNESTKVVLTEYATMILPLLFIGISLKRFGLGLKSLIGKPKEKTSKVHFVLNIISEILFSIGTLIIVGYILQSIIPSTDLSPMSEAEETRTLAVMGIHMYLIACILAPITEEILFRGLLLNRLKSKYGVNKALVVSSIVFALVHFDIGIAGRVLFGLITGIMYLNTKSLLPSILFHIFANSLLLLPNLLATNQYVESEPVDELITNDILIGALIITLLSTMWISCYLYKNWPKSETRLR